MGAVLFVVVLNWLRFKALLEYRGTLDQLMHIAQHRYEPFMLVRSSNSRCNNGKQMLVNTVSFLPYGLVFVSASLSSMVNVTFAEIMPNRSSKSLNLLG